MPRDSSSTLPPLCSSARRSRRSSWRCPRAPAQLRPPRAGSGPGRSSRPGRAPVWEGRRCEPGRGGSGAARVQRVRVGSGSGNPRLQRCRDAPVRQWVRAGAGGPGTCAPTAITHPIPVLLAPSFLTSRPPRRSFFFSPKGPVR